MVNFTNLPKYRRFTCQDCGQTDRGPEGATLCSQCRRHQEHPEEAPGYFTWTRTGDGWGARAKWRDKDPLPEPGQVIIVHRQDGTNSEQTVARVRNHHYDIAANLIVTVDLV